MSYRIGSVLFQRNRRCFWIYDLLGICPIGRISIDISRPASRVTRTAWPSVMELHDIEDIDKAEIRRWAGLFPGATELHLYAGFPCIHLSSFRAYRQNLEGDGSRLFWKLLQLLQWVQEVFSVTCSVKFCGENVASMDEGSRLTSPHQAGPCRLYADQQAKICLVF